MIKRAHMTNPVTLFLEDMKDLSFGLLAIWNIIANILGVYCVVSYLAASYSSPTPFMLWCLAIGNLMTAAARICRNPQMKIGDYFRPIFNESTAEIVAYVSSAPFIFFHLYKIIRK